MSEQTKKRLLSIASASQTSQSKISTGASLKPRHTMSQLSLPSPASTNTSLGRNASSINTSGDDTILATNTQFQSPGPSYDDDTGFVDLFDSR